MTFLREVRLELKRVEWPTREQLIKLTGAVCVLSVVVGSFLGFIDYLFQEIFRWIIQTVTGG